MEKITNCWVKMLLDKIKCYEEIIYFKFKNILNFSVNFSQANIIFEFFIIDIFKILQDIYFNWNK